VSDFKWPTMHIMTVPGSDSRRDALVQWWQKSGEYPGRVCLHADPERRGVLWNHVGILECALRGDQGAGWAMTMQDDVKPLTGWLEALKQVMQHAPAPFVSLGHLAKYGKRLVGRGIPFGVGVNAMWGQAMLIHFDVLEPYLDLAKTMQHINPKKYRNWDDYLPTIFNLIYGTEAAFTSRALVEHQDWESTLGHVPGLWRRAAATIRHAGPPWDAVPRSGRGAPGVERKHRDAASMVQGYWEQELGINDPAVGEKVKKWIS